MNDEQKRKTRDKVRRWRARHAVRLAMEQRQKSLTRMPGILGRPGIHRVLEVWTDEGRPYDALVIRAGDEVVLLPGTRCEKALLPSMAMSRREAEAQRQMWRVIVGLDQQGRPSA